MADKAKAFRWLGAHGPSDDRKGVLHIQMKGGIRIVVNPGELVKDAEQLAALGAERIEELVQSGYAEYLDLLEKLGVDELLRKSGVKSDSTPGEIKQTQDAASGAAARVDAAQNLAASAGAAGTPPDSRVTGDGMNSAGQRTAPTTAKSAPASAEPSQAAGPKE